MKIIKKHKKDISEERYLFGFVRGLELARDIVTESMVYDALKKGNHQLYDSYGCVLDQINKEIIEQSKKYNSKYAISIEYKDNNK
jgi:hypothetical protein